MAFLSEITCELNSLRANPRSKAHWAAVFFRMMQFGFLFYIAFLPIGRAFRETGSIIAVAFLLLYYIVGYKDSNLHRFGWKWIFFLFVGFLLFKSIHSIDPSRSFDALSGASYKGFFLYIVGLEFIRSRRSLTVLIAIFVFMGFTQGLNGIFQYITGYDFIRNETMMGTRLTGSFQTPRVGNLLALVLPVFFALPYLFPVTWSLWKRMFTTICLTFPPVFLLLGSQTRSGYFGAFVGLSALIWFRWGWKPLFLTAIFLIPAAFLFNPKLSVERISQDARWEIWAEATEVYSEYPLLGSGVNTFLPAKKSLSITQGKFSHHTHPHNSYVQLLTETGIVGLFIFFAFIFFHLFFLVKEAFSIKKINYNLSIIFFCFICSFISYLVTSFSAHSFFHSWWIGFPMSILGICVGIEILSFEERFE